MKTFARIMALIAALLMNIILYREGDWNMLVSGIGVSVILSAYILLDIIHNQNIENYNEIITNYTHEFKINNEIFKERAKDILIKSNTISHLLLEIKTLKNKLGDTKWSGGKKFSE